MPPRFAYWTILAGGLPTSFRAAEREELLPTFKRLKEKQPDAELKWFSRGKLWNSPEEARAASPSRPWSRDGGPRPERTGDDSAPPMRERERRRAAIRAGEEAPRERRGPEWRPGGDHRDPKQPFIDAKKARNQRVRQERYDRKQRREGEFAPRAPKPFGDRAPRSFDGDRPRSPKPFGDRKPRFDGDRKPRFDRDDQGPRERSFTPREDRPRSGGSGDRPFRKPAFSRDGGDRPRGPKPFGDRAPRSFDSDRPRAPKPFGDRKPRFDGDRKPRFERDDQGPRERSFTPREDRPRSGGFGDRPFRKPAFSRDGGDRPRGPKPFGDRAPRSFDSDRPRGPKPFGDRKPRFDREDRPFRKPAFNSEGGGDGPRREFRPRGEGQTGDRPWKPKPFGDRKPRSFDRPEGGERPRRPFSPRGDGEKRPWTPKGDGPRREFRPRGEGPGGAKKPFGAKRPFSPRTNSGPRRRRDDDDK